MRGIQAKLNTDCGPIELVIDDSEAGAAFFRDLVTSQPRTASFFRANRRVVALGPLGTHKRPFVQEVETQINTSGSSKQPFTRGTLAYAHNSTEIVLVSRGGEFLHGAVVGKLAKPKSMRLIEEIANRPSQNESLKTPVKFVYERSSQLRELMEFETRLKKRLGSK